MPVSIAYHASHEQFAPSHLLKLVRLAEGAGFDAIHSSDHFHPWSVNQGQSGYSFSWIGAAMMATQIPFSMVCAPGQRYHPAIVAQAIATLGEMFPNRFSIELGSGEALNESITGDQWPSKEFRNERLLQCVQVIRRLLQGKEVSFEGTVRVKEARLYSLPAQPPPLFCAAISAETAKWAASWADGLITTSGTPEQVKEKIDLFNSSGENKPVYVQYAFSYAPQWEEAIAGAWHQWKTNILPAGVLANLYKPEHFDRAAARVTKEEIAGKINIITSVAELFDNIHWLENMNISRVILHNINRNHEAFIAEYARYRAGNKQAH